MALSSELTFENGKRFSKSIENVLKIVFFVTKTGLDYLLIRGSNRFRKLIHSIKP